MAVNFRLCIRVGRIKMLGIEFQVKTYSLSGGVNIKTPREEECCIRKLRYWKLILLFSFKIILEGRKQ